MKIVIVGGGGVGGYFGGRMAEAGLDVTILARGEHLRAMRANGISIRSPLGDSTAAVKVAEKPEDAGPADLFIIATKAWQLPEAARSIAPLVGAHTMVLGLQNGVEAAADLAGIVGSEHVLAGACRLISFIEEPGVIRHVGGNPIIIFGEVAGGSSPRTEAVEREIARAENMTIERSDDIQLELWRKLIFFAPLAGVGSVTRSTVGVLRTVPESRAMLHAAMKEILLLAHARGVKLPDDAADKALAFVDTMPADGTSSMQRDFRDGKRTELDVLSGAVVRLARSARVPVPTHEFLHAALLPAELAARGELPAK